MMAMIIIAVGIYSAAYSAEKDAHRAQLRADYIVLNNKRVQKMPNKEQLNALIKEHIPSDFMHVAQLDSRLADQQLNPVHVMCALDKAMVDYHNYLKSRRIDLLRALFKDNPDAMACIEHVLNRVGGD